MEKSLSKSSTTNNNNNNNSKESNGPSLTSSSTTANNAEDASVPSFENEIFVVKQDPQTSGSSYLQLFNQLYKRTLFSDLALVIGEERMPTHKLVLSVNSEFFKAELQKITGPEYQVRIEQNRIKTFKQMIQFFYTGIVDHLLYDDVMELLRMADEFKANMLKNECGEILATGGSHENLQYLLDIASRFSCDSLKRKVGQIMAENFSDLMEEGRGQLMAMDPTIWRDIVMSPKVKIGNEKLLLEAVLKFAEQFQEKEKGGPRKQEEVLEMLLPHILFVRIPVNFLVEQVEHAPVVGEMPLVKQKLYEVFRFRATNVKSSSLPKREYDCVFLNSTLLDGEMSNQILEWIEDDTHKNASWELVYKGTRDGFDSHTFHTKCNNIGPTVTVVQTTKGYIFGGYTPLSWTSRGNYAWDNKTFLFSLVNKKETPFVKLKNDGQHASNSYSIYDNASYLPCFGGGHDICLASNCNINESSYSNLGHSFSLTGYAYNTEEAKSFLAGSYQFKVAEVEIFRITQ